MASWVSVLAAVAISVTAALAGGAAGQRVKFEVVTALFYPVFKMLWVSELHPYVLRSEVVPGYRYHTRLSGEDFASAQAWQPNHDDVFAITFPKTGSHFLVQMMLQVAGNASEELATYPGYAGLHHYATCPEILTESKIKQCADPRLMWLGNYRENKGIYPFVHSSHLPAHLVYKGAGARYIVMMREPVAVLMSLHRMLRGYFGRLAMPTLQVGKWITGEDPSGYGYAQYYLDWWERRNDEDVLFLFYEDAVREPRAAVEAITRFLRGEAGDGAAVERAVHRASRQFMMDHSVEFEIPQCANVFAPLPHPGHRVHMVNNLTAEERRAEEERFDPGGAVRARVRRHMCQVFRGTDFPLSRYVDC